jgi:hypothetical protein
MLVDTPHIFGQEYAIAPRYLNYYELEVQIFSGGTTKVKTR